MADLSNSAVFFEADASNTSGTVPTWQENMVPSLVNDSARALQGALTRFRNRIGPAIVSSGSANAQTLTYTVAPTAYVVGDLYSFTVGGTNTGATTLNINGLGAKNILLGANALQGGELRQAQMVMVGYDGTQFQLLRGITPAAAGFTPNNPTGRVGAAVMMGIGSTCTITPRVSGEIAIHLTGDIGSGTTAGTASLVQLRYGTGTAPANADAVTGTAVGSVISWLNTTYTAGDRYPFTCLGHATLLTVGTAYWIDISLSGTGGTVTAQNLSMILRESPR